MHKNIEYYENLPYEIIIKKLSKDDGGGYFARYKDFPYIMGDGATEEEALRDLREAFRGAIAVMIENGDSIKEPERQKSVRINITLPASLLQQIDAKSSNRSKFLADCARKALNV